MKLENFILLNLLDNEEYVRKTIPFLKEEYFKNKPSQIVYNLIDDYITKYNVPPNKEALYIELSNLKISEDQYKACKEVVSSLKSEKEFSLDWLLDKTEQFCKERAIHNALIESIDLAENKKDQAGKIPDILKEALGVCFDSNIGHNYVEDWEERFKYYTDKQKRKPFGISLLNHITDGGAPDGSLTVGIAGTGVGKSRWMGYEAACDLEAGRNVLYITLEMSEKEVSKRIDANLLDIDVNELKFLEKEVFKSKLDKLKIQGKLVVKEYPTGSASVLHFKHLVNELSLKKNFVPDVIYVDYINICASARIKRGGTTSYEYIKAIAEELRGLGVELKVPIITATQTTRSGYNSSDVGLEDTAESFGLPATADFMFAMITTDQLAELNQQLFKQLKNRLGDPRSNTRFVVGVDASKFRYYDVEQEAQEGITDSPVMSGTDFGQRMENDEEGFNKEMFKGFF